MLVIKPRRSTLSMRTQTIRVFDGSAYGGAKPLVTIGNPALTSNVAWEDYRDTVGPANYKFLIREGLNATGKLTGFEAEQKGDPNGVYYSKVTNNKGLPSQVTDYSITRGTTCPGGFPSGPASSATRAQNQALTRFYINARKAQTILQTGVVIGTLGQTLREIVHSAQGIRRGLFTYLGAVSHGNFLRTVKRNRNSASQLKFVRERWLEGSFGWLPLVHDIDDAMNLLATNPDWLEERVFVRGYGETESVITKNSGTLFTYKWETLTKDKWQVIYYGSVYRRSPYACPARDTGPSGLDPSNWLPTLWEIIPYSFVADYFFNIQQILSAYSFNQALIKWAAQTIRYTKSHKTFNAQQVVFPSETFISHSPGYSLHTEKSVGRQALGEVGIPTLDFTIPGLSTQWINLAALFAKGKNVQNSYR